MHKKSIIDSFLFKGVDENEAINLLRQVKYSERSFSRGEMIYSPRGFEKNLGILLLGECSVERVKPSGDKVPLNTLHPTDAFGILAVFTGNDEFPTLVTAKQQSSVAFFSRSEIEALMRLSHEVTLNIVNFLANRAQFLCAKISSFSSDNIEQRLAMYVYNEHLRTGSTRIRINKKRVAEELNTGRTSLYRAIDSLVDCGIISIDDKTILIIDLEGLERISK